MIETGRMADLMLDELVRGESSYGGKYAGAANEMLDYYLTGGWREANM